MEDSLRAIQKGIVILKVVVDAVVAEYMEQLIEIL